MLDSMELKRQEMDHGLSIDGVRTRLTHEKGQEPLGLLKFFMRCAAISAIEHSNSGKKSFDSIRFSLPNRFLSIRFDSAIL